jgi:chromosome segregation ATPase
MAPDALSHRGAAPFRVALALAIAAGTGAMLWGVGTHSVSFAGEVGGDAARETAVTLQDSVAALAAELAQVKAQTAKLRASQSDTSEEISHIRASLANTEIGLDALRTTTGENEARQRDAAAQIASSLATLMDQTLHLRMAQDDTAAEIGALRASVANGEIGLGELRATTGDINVQVQRLEAAKDITESIAKNHRHHVHRRWVTQRKWMAQR